MQLKKLRDILQERKGATFLQVLNNFELERTIFSGSILIYLGLSWSIFVYLGLSLAISGYSGNIGLSLVSSLSIMVYLGLYWSILVYISLSQSQPISASLRLYLAVSYYLGLSMAISGYLG